MHLLAEQTIAIACPVGAAYRYASNLEHFGQWFPGVIAIRSANGAAHASPGKEYLETVDVPGRGRCDIRIRVQEARPDEWLATEGEFAPLLPRMEMDFKALGAQACELTWRMWSRHPGDEMTRSVLWPGASRVMARRAAEGLARLRQRLESAPAP